MKPLDLTNPDRLTCDEMPPKMLDAMKACADAGARVELYQSASKYWAGISPVWVKTRAYRLWPLIGERREWRGGPCPVPAGAEVTVWRRGSSLSNCVASSQRWGHSKMHPALDIIAYRVDSLPEAVHVLPHATLITELRAMRMRPEVRKLVERLIAVVECGE